MNIFTKVRKLLMHCYL